jgi:RNA polymerase sigma factor (sigma-70 family)
MLMADRTDDRPEPQHLALDAAKSLDAAKTAEADDQLLVDDTSEASDASDGFDRSDATARAGTEKTERTEKRRTEKKQEPEPLPPAEPVTEREVDAFLREPSLRRAMITVVSGRVRAADVEDVVQEALWGVKRARRLPRGAKERRQYALAIARNKAKTWYRRHEEDRSGDVAFDELRGEAVEDPGIQRAIDSEHLDKITETVPIKQRSTLECMARHLMGENLAEMSREMGVGYDTLYKRVTTLHRRVRDTGKAIAGLAVVLLVLMGAWRVFKPEPEVATPPPPREAPTSAPSGSTDLRSDNAGNPPVLESPEALAKARELRTQAFQACTKDEWAACEGALEQASRLDPRGESDPRVQAARADVKAAAEHGGEKRWSPKRPRGYEEGKR